jgi:hypothetical protein
MSDSHESMTCGVNGIYLSFGSFNGMDPIIPKTFYWNHDNIAKGILKCTEKLVLID